MTPEERLDRIELQIEKQNTGIQGLVAVGRTCLEAIHETTEQIKELRDAQAATDERLNIRMDTVDRISRGDNSRPNGSKKPIQGSRPVLSMPCLSSKNRG